MENPSNSELPKRVTQLPLLQTPQSVSRYVRKNKKSLSIATFLNTMQTNSTNYNKRNTLKAAANSNTVIKAARRETIENRQEHHKTTKQTLNKKEMHHQIKSCVTPLKTPPKTHKLLELPLKTLAFKPTFFNPLRPGHISLLPDPRLRRSPRQNGQRAFQYPPEGGVNEVLQPCQFVSLSCWAPNAKTNRRYIVLGMF